MADALIETRVRERRCLGVEEEGEDEWLVLLG